MINNKSSFCRNENKYLLSRDDIPFLVAELSKHLPFDSHSPNGAKYEVNTIYFDNEEYSMISRSISHPAYKEKMRIRSYGGSTPSYFLEMKNKFGSDVYKNRIELSSLEAKAMISSGQIPAKNGDYKHDRFLETIEIEEERRGILLPKCLIQYKRIAFLSSPDDEYTRVTMDTDMTMRYDNFSINELGGVSILNNDKSILEIKVGLALPLYLVEIMNQLKVTRTAFSKYGTAFLTMENSGESTTNLLSNHPEKTVSPSVSILQRA